MKMNKTPYFSYKQGNLPKGCQFCVKGEKLVLFITGICNRNCFYCPLSEKKKNKDVLFANEWDAELKNKIAKKQFDIIVKEAKLCDAKGAGITGGDPLLVNERTVIVIKRLKKTFGKKFHIHLYTSLNNVTEERLNKLYSAGLDEIRVHPEFDNERFWNRINLLNKYDWDVGVEIPAVPGYERQIKKLIDFINNKINFLNLNELELSDTNVTNLIERGYRAKNVVSYGAKGSEELALKLMKYCRDKKYKFNIHYCTCKLKDAVQLAKRIKRRAKNVAHDFDKITKEGILIRGAVYLPELYPSFSYKEKLKNITSSQRKRITAKLNKIKNRIGSLVVDSYKLRLLGSSDFVRKNAEKIKKLKLIPAIVEEYPTHDEMEIEVNPL